MQSPKLEMANVGCWEFQEKNIKGFNQKVCGIGWEICVFDVWNRNT